MPRFGGAFSCPGDPAPSSPLRPAGRAHHFLTQAARRFSSLPHHRAAEATSAPSSRAWPTQRTYPHRISSTSEAHAEEHGAVTAAMPMGNLRLSQPIINRCIEFHQAKKPVRRLRLPHLNHNVQASDLQCFRNSSDFYALDIKTSRYGCRSANITLYSPEERCRDKPWLLLAEPISSGSLNRTRPECHPWPP